MAVGFQVTFDAGDTVALSAFWAEALGYVAEPPPRGYDSWEAFAAEMGLPAEDWDKLRAIVDPDGHGPRLLFQRVPEAKSAKNRVHLDVNVGGSRATPEPERRAAVADAVARLTELGATVGAVHDEMGAHWVVMQDPEGNEFCLQ